MASKIKSNIGTMACGACGESIPVKQVEGGTLHIACPWCDYKTYPRKGEQCHGLLLAKVKRAPDTREGEGGKPAAPEVAAPPAVKKPTTIFGI